jgi:putative oxidoreductase
MLGILILLYVHGRPKLIHFSAELARIKDPFGLGAGFSLVTAIVAEVACPRLIAVRAIAMLVVHAQWSLAAASGQRKLFSSF